jgi:hypothetical protein
MLAFIRDHGPEDHARLPKDSAFFANPCPFDQFGPGRIRLQRLGVAGASLPHGAALAPHEDLTRRDGETTSAHGKGWSDGELGLTMG